MRSVQTLPEILVFHIVWRAFGAEPFRNFLRSYISHNSGRKHRLILIYKGFSNESELSEYRQLLHGVRHETINIADQGLDIGTYLEAASQIRGDFYCFFNSKSVLLTDSWLEKLYAHASRSDVGLVGATGSWQSLYTDFPSHHDRAPSNATGLRKLIRSSFINRLRHMHFYPPFPNAHIRTNAFLITRKVLENIHVRRIRTRVDTSRFESGKIGLTRQIFDMRLQAIVVGKNGDGYLPDDWADSKTFWQSAQENLLAADNQTDRYAAADSAEKLLLSNVAWGCNSRLKPSHQL